MTSFKSNGERVDLLFDQSVMFSFTTSKPIFLTNSGAGSKKQVPGTLTQDIKWALVSLVKDLKVPVVETSLICDSESCWSIWVPKSMPMTKPIHITHSDLPYTVLGCLLPINWEPSVTVLTWREWDMHSGTQTNVVTTFQKVAGALWELWPYCSYVLVFSLSFLLSVCDLTAWWAVKLFCFSYKASKEAGKALVCKTNPTFETQHHHLLHCLEKTTVRVCVFVLFLFEMASMLKNCYQQH